MNSWKVAWFSKWSRKILKIAFYIWNLEYLVECDNNPGKQKYFQQRIKKAIFWFHKLFDRNQLFRMFKCNFIFASKNVSEIYLQGQETTTYWHRLRGKLDPAIIRRHRLTLFIGEVKNRNRNKNKRRNRKRLRMSLSSSRHD
jgi:hypothetical protein